VEITVGSGEEPGRESFDKNHNNNNNNTNNKNIKAQNNQHGKYDYVPGTVTTEQLQHFVL